EAVSRDAATATAVADETRKPIPRAKLRKLIQVTPRFQHICSGCGLYTAPAPRCHRLITDFRTKSPSSDKSGNLSGSGAVWPAQDAQGMDHPGDDRIAEAVVAHLRLSP